MTNYVCDPVELGARLKEARMNTKAEFTQIDFAEEVGITPAVIRRVEQGVQFPKIDLLMDYINFCDVDANYLLGISEEASYGIDKKLELLSPIARRYLLQVFNEMIDIFPKC